MCSQIQDIEQTARDFPYTPPKQSVGHCGNHDLHGLLLTEGRETAKDHELRLRALELAVSKIDSRVEKMIEKMDEVCVSLKEVRKTGVSTQNLFHTFRFLGWLSPLFVSIAIPTILFFLGKGWK